MTNLHDQNQYLMVYDKIAPHFSHTRDFVVVTPPWAPPGNFFMPPRGFSLQFSGERAPNGLHPRPPLGRVGQISGTSLKVRRLDVRVSVLGGKGVPPLTPVTRLHVEKKMAPIDGTTRGPTRKRGAQCPPLCLRRQRRVPKRLRRMRTAPKGPSVELLMVLRHV